MKKTLPVLAVVLLIVSGANAQYDTLWIGTADGPSTNLDNTPFATEVARASRTHYLVRSQDLQQAGLSSEVVGICFQVVDDDLTDPACLLDLHTEMKNDVTSSLSDFTYSGLMSTGTAAQVNLAHGILGLEFATPWQWLGPGLNAVVEISYERSEEAGVSPRILLDMDLDYTATFTGRTAENVMGHDISGLYPSDVETGSDNSLPVLGLLIEASTYIHDATAKNMLDLFPNPASTLIHVQAPEGTRSLRITDTCGRAVLSKNCTAGQNSIDIATLPAGCYSVSALSDRGVVAYSRFINE